MKIIYVPIALIRLQAVNIILSSHIITVSITVLYTNITSTLPETHLFFISPQSRYAFEDARKANNTKKYKLKSQCKQET